MIIQLTQKPILIILFCIFMMPGKADATNPEKWWLQSSKVDSVENFLIHASGRYSFSRMKGVISGNTNSGYVSLVMRKHVFTNYAVYTHDKMDMSLKSSITLDYATTAHYFTDFVDVDLSKLFYTQAGFIWEMDDALLIKNRYSIYLGAGLNNVVVKKLKIKTLFAAGRIDQEYIIPVDDLDVIKEPYTAFYFRQNYAFAIDHNLSLTGQFYYFTNMDDMERYRYGIDLNLSIGLVKHVNLVAGYSFKYDRENVLLGIIPENSMQNIGVEINL